MVWVAGLNAQFASDFVGRDGASIFAAEVVQIRYVVLDLGQKERRMLPCAKFPGFAVDLQGLGKLIETDVGDTEVAEDNRGIEDLSLFFEDGISALIKCDGFLKTVLTMTDISDIRIETGQAKPVAMFFEDGTRSLAPFDRDFVFAKIDQTLQCGAHGARKIQLPVQRGIDRNRRLIVLACELVFVLEVVDVSKRAQTQGAGKLVSKLTAQPGSCSWQRGRRGEGQPAPGESPRRTIAERLRESAALDRGSGTHGESARQESERESQSKTDLPTRQASLTSLRIRILAGSFRAASGIVRG